MKKKYEAPSMEGATMKKKYEAPSLEVTVLEGTDVILTSGLSLIDIGNLGHDTINFSQIEIDLQ